MNHRRYIAYTVYWVISFTRTGYIPHVAGGRLPPLRQHTTFFVFYERKTGVKYVNIRPFYSKLSI